MQILSSIRLHAILLLLLFMQVLSDPGHNCNAQAWDWLRGSEYPWFNLNTSWEDSAANIFSCASTVVDSNVMRHSKRFSDTFFSNDYSNDEHYLIKSNRRGIVLWKASFYGSVVDMDFRNGYVYLLTRFSFNRNYNFQFGSVMINEARITNRSQFSYYYVYKFSQNGTALDAGKIMEITDRSRINNFAVRNDGDLLFYIQNATPAGSSNKCPFTFKNTTLFDDQGGSTGNYCFLLSAGLHSGLKWIRNTGYCNYTLTENGANRMEYRGGNSIFCLEYDSMRLADRMFFRKRDLNGQVLYELPLQIKRKDWLVGIKQDLSGHFLCYGNFKDSMRIGQRTLTGSKSDGNGFIIRLNPQFKILSAWLPESESFSPYDYCTDQKGVIYAAVMFSDSLKIGNAVLQANGTPNNRFGSLIAVLDSNVSGIKTITLPSNSKNLYFRVWTDPYDKLYTSGYMDSKTVIEVPVDSMTFDASMYNQIPFQAKLEPQKLGLKHRVLNCGKDSLRADADTVYKWFRWQIGDTLICFGAAVKTELPEGWHRVKLYGYEADSVMSLHIDSFFVSAQPKAMLLLSGNKVCRYTALQFRDSSRFGKSSNTEVNARLSFGDQTDTVLQFKSTGKPPFQLPHSYRDTGLKTIVYTIDHSGCRDTLILLNAIRVIDSPQPGFTIAPVQGCAPLLTTMLDTVTNNVRRKNYFFSDSGKWTSPGIYQASFAHTYTKPGVYRVVQTLEGFTGCITRTDSAFVHVSKGLLPSDSLHIYNATVSNKKALVYWPRQDGALLYELFKDGLSCGIQSDTFYNDTNTYLQDAVYNVRAFDSCGSSGSSGRAGKPIFLRGNMIGYNAGARLHFSEYRRWQSTALQYRVQKRESDGQGNYVWKTLRTGNDTLYFEDPDFFEAGKTNATYRIEASALANPALMTHSNEVRIPYIPVVYLPNAFSPNTDGNNDVYQPVVFGIETYTLTIVNRWGEIVFQGRANEAWQAGAAPEGVYAVLMHYTTNDGRQLRQRATLTLLR